MMREAEAHADEDKRLREEAETRNRADQAVYGAERMLQDAGDKLSSADKQPVQEAIDELKKALEKNDAEPIKRAMDHLTTAQHKAAEVLYRSAASPGQAPGEESSGQPAGASGSTKPDDVIDAEVVEDDKK
jgi:molecular chaperone DnaK